MPSAATARPSRRPRRAVHEWWMKEAACLKDYSAISPLRRRHQSTLRAWRGKHFHRDDISGGNITLETTPAPPPLFFLSPPTPPSLPHTGCQEKQCRLGSRSRSTTCERMHANEDATTHELKRSTRHRCTITAPRTCVARAASDWAWQQTGRPVPRAPGRRRRRRGEPSRDGGEIVASIIRFDEPCQLSVSTSAPPQLGAIY